MNNEQLHELNRMKKLIRDGKKRFESRNDRDYLNDLNNLNLTPDDAWNHILSLNKNLYFPDTRLDLTKNNDGLTFKKIINSKTVYIKLKIEFKYGEEAVCLSFHEDWR